MIIFIKVFIVIYILYFKIILFYKNIYFFIKSRKEYGNIEKFLQFSIKIKSNRKIRKSIDSPKISVISPVFNSENIY